MGNRTTSVTSRQHSLLSVRSARLFASSDSPDILSPKTSCKGWVSEIYTHPQKNVATGDALQLRQDAGKWLQGLRKASGRSQREFAEAAGIGFYTFVSQIERGRARVPPSQVRVWSQLLNVPSRDFAITLMKYYDPLNHDLIFGNEAVAPQSSTLESKAAAEGMELQARLSKVEARIDKLNRQARRLRVTGGWRK